MRCPTCGTENEPDSRFCGVCGAKLTPAANRVAPTAKIPDDAPFPPHYGGGYSTGPASIPPNQQFAVAAPASIPPNTYQAPGYVTAPAQQRSSGPQSSPPRAVPMREPSMSMPAMPPRPRWGLILLVLVLDAGLASAGALMLAKGLAKPDVVETAPAPTPAPAKKAEVAPLPAPPPAIEKAAPAIAASIAQATEAPAPADDPTPAKQAAARPKTVAKGPAPMDPYAPSSTLKTEIELESARSRDAFAKCRGDAGDVKGRIDIAVRVETDGRVGDAHINTNSTGSQPLALCLVTEIRRWAFASHPSQPVELVRPFIY